MSDTIDTFPQYLAGKRARSKPTIAEILIEGFTTDQTGVAMLKRIAEHYPKVTQEDFNAAMAAAQDALAGRQHELGRLEAEVANPTVPVHRVVERIVNQTLDAVEARRSNEPTTARSVIEAAAGSITQHPGQQAILLWLATEKLEAILDSAARERGIALSYTFGSPLRVEATEQDLNYVPPED
jgi:hypothetical protein